MRFCTVEGCPRKHSARGYCFRHWNAVVRAGWEPSELQSRSRSGFEEGGDKDLNENEFVLMKEYRTQHRTQREIALELDKLIGVIAEAWQYKTYSQYQKRVPIEDL